jgi:hypothetical protein
MQYRKAGIISEPKPGTRPVLDQKTLPVAVSSGDIDFLCGSCEAVLLKGMIDAVSFGNMVIKCPKCGNFNDISASTPAAQPPAATQPVAPPPVPPQPAMPRPTTIPHPEEAMNPSARIANINVNAIMTKWFQDWQVPSQYWDYWKTAIDIQVHDVYPASLLSAGIKQDTPAGTWEAGGKRHLAVKPQWLNPGVIAHEQAHNSFALLNANQKAAYATVHNSLKNTDYLIRLLYSKNQYGLSTDVEGHAEVYRYIGQYMPEQMKQYYPKLF